MVYNFSLGAKTITYIQVMMDLLFYNFDIHTYICTCSLIGDVLYAIPEQSLCSYLA